MLSILSPRCLCGEEEPRKQLTKLDIGTPSNFVHVQSHTQVKRFQTHHDHTSHEASLSSSSSDSVASQNKIGLQNDRMQKDRNNAENGVKHIIKEEKDHALNNTFTGVNLQISCESGSSNSLQTDSRAASSCGEEVALPSSNEDDSLSSTGNINIGNKNGEYCAFQRTVVGTSPTPTIKPLPSPTMAN